MPGQNDNLNFLIAIELIVSKSNKYLDIAQDQRLLMASIKPFPVVGPNSKKCLLNHIEILGYTRKFWMKILYNETYLFVALNTAFFQHPSLTNIPYPAPSPHPLTKRFFCTSPQRALEKMKDQTFEYKLKALMLHKMMTIILQFIQISPSLLYTYQHIFPSFIFIYIMAFFSRISILKEKTENN